METKSTHHLNFLFDITERTDTVTRSPDTEERFARHFNDHICSIYLFNNQNIRWVLKATQGLNPDAGNHISMVPGQGLVGRSFYKMSAFRDGNASKNPKFKYFSEADEDLFDSFLRRSHPRGIKKIGVMVVQHKEIDGSVMRLQLTSTSVRSGC